MSTTAGAIYVEVKLDDKDFDSGLNTLNSKVEKSGGFLSNALSFATGGAILGGLSAIKDGISSVAGAMIDGNAEFETYETQFGVLLGSADEAKTRLAELAKFGASTPFELPELVRADKVLTSFGIHSQDMLTIVGDVAAGTGASFEDMALLMGKFSAGATGEVISRFAELGIASRAELANLGLEFSKSGELLSPLPQSMEVVQNLMKEKFGGMMDAQSQTFAGMMSNLQDWVAGTLRTLGQPIFEVAKDKLGVLISFLGSPEVQATLDAVAQSLATGIGASIDFLSNTAIPALIEAWNTMQPAVQLVMSLFTQAGDGAGVLGAYIDALAVVWTALQDTINAVVPPIREIVLSVFSVIQDFLHAHGADIEAFIKTTWAQIAEVIKLAAQLVQAIVVPIFTAIANFIRENQDTIVAALSAAWEIIKSVINIALAVIQGVIKTVLAVIQGDWQGAWDAIKTMAITVWDNIKVLIGAAIELIKANIELWLAALKGIFQGAWDYIKVNIIQAAWDGIKSIVQSAIDGLKSAIETGFNGVKTYIQGIVNDITGIFNGLVSNMSSIGANIVEGIKSGIRDNWGGFVNWVTGQLSGLKDEILNFFGIHSPSTVMAHEVGKPLVQGILMGMREALPNLLNFVSEMSDDILKTIGDATKQINNLIVGSLDAQASLDRQQIQNLEKISEMDMGVRDAMNRTLARAMEEAQKITDPQQQAKFFAMRSKQIFEAEELRQKLVDAQSAGDTATAELIDAQIRLLRDAQKAEQDAFAEQLNQQGDAVEDMATKLSEALTVHFDPVLAELLQKLIQMFNLNMLVPPAPMGNGLLAMANAGAGMRGGAAVVNNYNLTIQTNNVAPLEQEFNTLRALNATY